MTKISIHAAREGGDLTSAGTVIGQTISIHAAREGGDGAGMAAHGTLSISIHAAREGGDGAHRPQLKRQRYFNPRRP